MRFEANRGQTDEQVKYLARATGYNIFLAENEADIVLHHETKPSETVARGKIIVVQAYANVLRLRFANSNPPTKIVPLLYRRSGGNSASAECTAVAYRGVYAGTDIIFRGEQQKIGLDLDLSPGADLNGIVLTLDGATGIVLDAAGNAVVRVGGSFARSGKADHFRSTRRPAATARWGLQDRTKQPPAFHRWGLKRERARSYGLNTSARFCCFERRFHCTVTSILRVTRFLHFPRNWCAPLGIHPRLQYLRSIGS